MNRYLVLLSTKTGVRFSPEEARYSFELGPATISFRRIGDLRDKEISGRNKEISGLDYGWMVEVRLDGENIDIAIDRAIELSEFFLSAFCLRQAARYIAQIVSLPMTLQRRSRKGFLGNIFTIYHIPLQHK